MTRRPRRLTPEERELWSRVAAATTALHPEHSRRADPEAADAAKPAPHRTKPALPEFRIGESVPDIAFGHDLAPSLSDRLARTPVRMDRKAHKQMTRGKLVPEARIDLHGMTLAQAHPALTGFLRDAHARGVRLALVITGKGRRGADDGPIPQRQGVLRHQVPVWLHQPPLGAIVLQVAEAHLRHGGSGAYYVYLRRGG
jgi:DNA-nicking Smr family endonuclease